MKGLLIVLALAVASSDAKFVKGAKAKFGIPLIDGDNAFYEIPINTTRAEEMGWVNFPRNDTYLPSLICKCEEDNPTLCGLYDEGTEQLAGMQVAFPEANVTNLLYSWDKQGYLAWEPYANGTIYRQSSVFIISEETMAKSVDERLAIISDEKLLAEDAFWVRGFDGEIDKTGDSVEEIKTFGYTEQACVPFMGTHYYYNMSSSTQCSADKMYPSFVLADASDNKAKGVAKMVFGDMPNSLRKYFEDPSQLAVKVIVPRGPECLYDDASSPGVITIHLYFIGDPTSMGCSLFGK